MRVFDHSFDTPAENLALDEVLLDRAESGEAGECLRFWESPTPFVVLGLSQSIHEHVYVEACERDGIPIQRRCTAGGCVVQGPGCLNYAFVLRSDREGCDTIHGSYRTLLGALSDVLSTGEDSISHAGISDLAIGARKISGSAQKRRRRYFLHHGTLLYAFDAHQCAAYLKEPPDRPDYRGERDHAAFIRNLAVTRERLVARVSDLFPGVSADRADETETFRAESLARDKYDTHSWVYKR